jgi:hypothetical protein
LYRSIVAPKKHKSAAFLFTCQSVSRDLTRATPYDHAHFSTRNSCNGVASLLADFDGRIGPRFLPVFPRLPLLLAVCSLAMSRSVEDLLLRVEAEQAKKQQKPANSDDFFVAPSWDELDECGASACPCPSHL